MVKAHAAQTLRCAPWCAFEKTKDREIETARGRERERGRASKREEVSVRDRDPTVALSPSL